MSAHALAAPCAHRASSVVETRERKEFIYRRRQCAVCGERFNSYETTRRPDAPAVR